MLADELARGSIYRLNDWIHHKAACAGVAMRAHASGRGRPNTPRPLQRASSLVSRHRSGLRLRDAALRSAHRAESKHGVAIVTAIVVAEIVLQRQSKHLRPSLDSFFPCRMSLLFACSKSHLFLRWSLMFRDFTCALRQESFSGLLPYPMV
jgi:hypothetical protein